ncbi:hypothetical protein [Nocardia sp. NPDC004604]
MNANTSAPRAIGVLSLNVTGPHLLRDERVITELAPIAALDMRDARF